MENNNLIYNGQYIVFINVPVRYFFKFIERMV